MEYSPLTVSLLIFLASTIQTAASSDIYFVPAGICEPGYVGNIRNPANCSTFITCDVSGIPIVRSCPERLCYSELADWCDWCYNVLCNDRPTTTPIDESNPPCPPDPAMNLPVFVPYPGECAKFYFCRQDGSFGGVGDCAKDLWFDFDQQTCTVPWTSSCPFQ